MTVYPKIPAPFKRFREGPDNGKLIMGEWVSPELEYLADNEWYFTEKVDGCVDANTRVRMADGSTKYIKDISVGEYVLGRNEFGPVASRVNAVKMQPPAGEWVEVKATRTGLGSGNHFGKVVCTHDHKIWTTDRGWVEAHTLRPGDRVLGSRTDLRVNNIQRSVLLGKLLGDGSLAYHDSSTTASVEFGHSEAQTCLVDWTLLGLGSLAGNKGSRTSGYGSNIVTGRSQQAWGVYHEFRGMIVNGQKTVPKDIADLIDPIVLAFWYMDDGTLQHHSGQEDRLQLATNGFDYDSCLNLQSALERFGILSRIADYRGHTICLNADNADRFFLLVAPYIVEGMRYKLPERYRAGNAWLPEGGSEFHSIEVPQTVLSVERVARRARWDIETDTSNFFTAGMLVHNTNIRIYLRRTGTPSIMTVDYRGRTDNADIPAPLLLHLEEAFPTFPDWRRDFDRPLFDKRYQEVRAWMGGNDLAQVTLYGEGYGPKIQNGGRYRSDPSFVLFDVKIDEFWLSRDNVNDVAEKLGIDSVPVVGRGTLNDAFELVRNGLRSQWGEFFAEGLVCRTTVPLFNSKGERITVKVKSVDFK